MNKVEDCISFLVGKAAQQVAKRARERLASFAVTPVQYAVLNVLWETDGQGGTDLCARLKLDSATITGVLDRLEANGHVKRSSDPSDRRVHRIFLTPVGRALEQPLSKEMGTVNEEIAGALGADAGAFWTMLRRIGDLRAQ